MRNTRQDTEKDEETRLLEEQITESGWFKILVVIVVIIAFCLFGYRYFLVSKAITSKQYFTAFSLTSPEIGLLATML